MLQPIQKIAAKLMRAKLNDHGKLVRDKILDTEERCFYLIDIFSTLSY